jgi:uncharacterized membrane protein YphA (DoxX/SURF4 family)
MQMGKGKNIFREVLGWLLLILILVSGFVISRYENWNLLFTFLLVAEIVLVIIFINYFSKLQITISRIILGCLFVFSGFVKGIDPVGTQYLIEDYFIAFGTDWAIPFALPLSVILNATEFVLGILLLLNVNMRISAWLVLVMMSVFTLLTFNDATNNPVPDCGCFGDVLIISNWQTFYKNLVIDALLLMVFLTRKRIPGWFNYRVEWTLLAFAILGFVYFEVHNIRHLPAIDFMDWKVGKKMMNENPLPLKYYLKYRNKHTGQTKEYLSPDYPYNDSAWMANWEFVNQRVVDPNPHLHDMRAEDERGNDQTQAILENPGYQFMLISFDLSKANLKQMDQIRDLINYCNQTETSFVVITSSLPADALIFKKTHDLDTDFYFADDVILMAMIRSNPGLILMKNGVILSKWHFNDFPTAEEVKVVYPSFAQ